MIPNRQFVWSLLFLIGLFAPAAFAGEGFFSPDGTTVTIVANRSETPLLQIEIQTAKVTPVPLPPELNGEYIDSLARGAEGETLFLAKDTVWVWTGKPDAPVKAVCPAEPVKRAKDLFVVTTPGKPLTDCLFLSGINEEDAPGLGFFHGRMPGAKNTFRPVFCRRVSEAVAGAFNEEGRLFFVCDGDLWEGGISVNDDPAMDWLGTLVGARIAPLGILNTDDANGGGLWASSIAPAGPWIYVQLRGRHMATIVRIPMPEKTLYGPEGDDFPTVPDQLNAMKSSLNSVEILADNLDDVFGFCAIEIHGKPRVFWCTVAVTEGKGPAMWLWDGEGEPREIGTLPQE